MKLLLSVLLVVPFQHLLADVEKEIFGGFVIAPLTETVRASCMPLEPMEYISEDIAVSNGMTSLYEQMVTVVEKIETSKEGSQMDGDFYDLSGRKISVNDNTDSSLRLKRGVYIVNRKKVVIQSVSR